MGVDTAESTSRGWSRDGDDDCPCTRPARPLANVLQSSDLNVVRSRHNDGSICAAAAMRAVATISVATRPSSELLRGRRVAHRVLLQRDRIAEGRQWRRAAPRRCPEGREFRAASRSAADAKRCRRGQPADSIMRTLYTPRLTLSVQR